MEGLPAVRSCPHPPGQQQLTLSVLWPMAYKGKDLDVQTRHRASHMGQRAQGMQAADGSQLAALCQPVFI